MELHHYFQDNQANDVIQSPLLLLLLLLFRTTRSDVAILVYCKSSNKMLHTGLEPALYRHLTVELNFDTLPRPIMSKASCTSFDAHSSYLIQNFGI